ncbi:hypothetical protein M8494_22905 [Serratia ureilytica]
MGKSYNGAANGADRADGAHRGTCRHQGHHRPVDRIFTRVARRTIWLPALHLHGGDDRNRQHLHNATEHSLVLMDEIGCGTSTYDGLSAGLACAENLANRIKAMTLFATHYFGADDPAGENGRRGQRIWTLEHGDTIAFMHSVQDGAASKAGTAVAALAGVPRDVISARRSCASWSLSPATPPRAASMPPR